MRHPLFDPGPAIRYHHVDVFTDRAMAGNGLAVVEADASLDGSVMLAVTRVQVLRSLLSLNKVANVVPLALRS